MDEGNQAENTAKDAQAHAELHAEYVGPDHAAPEDESFDRARDPEARQPEHRIDRRASHRAEQSGPERDESRRAHDAARHKEHDEQLARPSACLDPTYARRLAVRCRPDAQRKHPASQNRHDRSRHDGVQTGACHERAYGKRIRDAKCPCNSAIHAAIASMQ